MGTIEVAAEKKQVSSALSPRTRLRAGRNDINRKWAAGWATAGAAVWAGMAVLARIGVARIGAIELVFLFAPLVIVPLGMELARVSGGASSEIGRWLELAQVLQPLGAALVVVAFWLPVGKWAGVASAGWLVVCGIAGLGGATDLVGFVSRKSRKGTRAWDEPVDCSGGEGDVRSLVRWRALGMTGALVADVAGDVARIDLVVGAAWLVASRLGMRPMGIQEPIGLLTAVHFHFAGFATAMIASAAARFTSGRGTWLRRVVWVVVGMPFLVAAGFVISPALKMVAAVVFSASVVGLAGFLWRCEVKDRRARRFLQAAAGSVLAGVVMAGVYAVADFAGSRVLTIPRMASSHGILNGFGFCLLGLLGWLVEWEGRDLGAPG